MSGFPQNILVVDDDRQILEIVSEGLLRAGDVMVKVCQSCDEAVSIAHDFSPDLILLDLAMPDKDGPETIRVLHEVFGEDSKPMIFVTGNTQVVMQDDYKKLGVIGIVYKPFRPSELAVKIQGLWQKHSLGT